MFAVIFFYRQKRLWMDEFVSVAHCMIHDQQDTTKKLMRWKKNCARNNLTKFPIGLLGGFDGKLK